MMYTISMGKRGSAAESNQPQPWIFEEIESSGLKWADFAKALDELPQTINSWKKRGYVPGAKWRDVARVLKRSMNWVAYGADNPEWLIEEATGPELNAIIAALGYETEALRRVWVRIQALMPDATSWPVAQQTDLILLVADTHGEHVTIEQLMKLMRRLHHSKM